jgi:hypothetical protein
MQAILNQQKQGNLVPLPKEGEGGGYSTPAGGF